MSTAARGYYSLIQYCPNRSRLEAANVGVVLFSPEKGFLEARLVRGNDRLRRFFGSENLDLKGVEIAKRAISNRLRTARDGFKTLEDLEHFIATRANALILTPSRPMKVTQPAEDLKTLYEELVGGRAKGAPALEPFRAVDEIFRRPDIQNRIQFDRDIRVPVIGRTLKIPYAYKNGILNLVKPVEFSAAEAKATNSAIRLSLEGDLLAKHGVEGGDARLVVIPEFAADTSPELEQAVTDLFEEYKVRTIAMNQLADFAEEIRRTAH